MSADRTGAASDASSASPPAGAGEAWDSSTDAGDAQERPSEEQLRAAYEAEMSRISSADMILQAAVSLLNIGGYRLGLSAATATDGGGERPASGERDLEQVRDAIEGVRALLPILERTRAGELRPLRDALSQLQMAYAREARASTSADQTAARGEQAASAAKPDAPAEQESSSGPGPAQASGRLWVPGR